MTYTNTPPNNCNQSNPASNCRLKINGSAQEQTFIGNLVTESIDLYGQDVYYLPRTFVNKDTILNEIESSTFSQALPIRMYVNDVEGWEGQGELLSKFGIRIENKTTFVVSRARFQSEVDANATLNVEGRPNEGDLIWFPIASKLFEIKFVEHERPFYQLGKGYVWELQCELFEYADEELDTGVAEIDAVETAHASSMKLVMDPGGTGHYTIGETVRSTNHDAVVGYTHQDWTLGFTVWDGGEGYDPNDPPTITFTPPPEGGTQATGTVQVNSSGLVTGITLNPGSGYTSAPGFTLETSPLAVSAEVKSWNPATRELEIINRNGTFNTVDSVKGLTSNAVWSPYTYNTINNTNSNYDQNDAIESESEDILDFAEGNPFGTIRGI